MGILYLILFPLDDGWMSISEGELDDILRTKMRTDCSQDKSEDSRQDRSSKKDYTELQSAVYGMKSFVDKVSSHTGAEFPWYV